jgi:hypothetical protein
VKSPCCIGLSCAFVACRKYDERPVVGSTLALDPNRVPARQGGMPTPEVISLIIALVAWILLLRSFSVDG